MTLTDGTFDIPAGKIVTVITHLEMTERADPLREGAGPRTLRKVETPGLDWFRDLYRRVGEKWLWLSRAGMPDAELLAIIQSPLVGVYALAQDGHDEGLVELDFRVPGQCEIVSFGVTAKLIGSGAGSWMMNCTLELAWSPQVTRVWLHTCTLDHPAALAFYQRAGFRPFRRQVEIDNDPRLDGAAPRAAARHVPIIE
jgi:GNAT superfamily N-acetyltransferase